MRNLESGRVAAELPESVSDATLSGDGRFIAYTTTRIIDYNIVNDLIIGSGPSYRTTQSIR